MSCLMIRSHEVHVLTRVPNYMLCLRLITQPSLHMEMRGKQGAVQNQISRTLDLAGCSLAYLASADVSA